MAFRRELLLYNSTTLYFLTSIVYTKFDQFSRPGHTLIGAARLHEEAINSYYFELESKGNLSVCM